MEESEVAGFIVFSHIRKMGYLRLFKIRVNKCPAGLEPPAGARNRKKATAKKPATSDSSFDPK